MFKLRPYQEPVADLVFAYMKEKKGHPLVAIPTGGGKTVILAELIKESIKRWPSTKVLILSHVKEILYQNYDAIEKHTQMSIGMYSAGVGKREIEQVTVAGIQSVFRKPELFADFDLIIIDECHRIPLGDDTMYLKFFAGLKNPKYFGLTATPYRLGSGLIYGDEEKHLFSHLIYDLTSKEKFNKLIEDGYLCDLKVQATNMELDPDGVKTTAGDYDNKELSEKFDVKMITKLAVKEIIKSGAAYKKWLVFAIDIEHAENIAEELAKNDIPTMVIHSKMEFDRDTVIRHYKLGTFRAIVNVNVLTTGFDDPEIDLIALLRPTKSPVIHVQTIGRGLRIADGKDHCLILDFAGNTERLGPINDIRIKKKGKGQKGGEAITKRCPECNTIHAPAVRICPHCGYKFEFKSNLAAKSGSIEVIAKKTKPWVKVDKVTYAIHQKRNSPDMIKVSYHCGLRMFQEYICIQHKQGSWAHRRAVNWLQYRGLEDARYADVHAVMDKSHMINTPKQVKLDKNGKYTNIVDYSF
jgi:DNA repair protein RadD